MTTTIVLGVVIPLLAILILLAVGVATTMLLVTLRKKKSKNLVIIIVLLEIMAVIILQRENIVLTLDLVLALHSSAKLNLVRSLESLGQKTQLTANMKKGLMASLRQKKIKLIANIKN